MTNMVERVAMAMQDAVIRDDEGEFPRLFDLLGFSGENKAVTVVRGLAEAAIKAMSYPNQDMILAGVMALSNSGIDEANLNDASECFAAMIDAALTPKIEE